MDEISEFLETEEGVEYEIVPMSEKPLVEHSDEVHNNVSDDYKQARQSMKSTIEVGTSVIDKLAKLAEEAESPRAYEVLANTLKTITEMNESLMNLHSNAQKLLKQENVSPETINNTQNIVFHGSVEELQKALKVSDDKE